VAKEILCREAYGAAHAAPPSGQGFAAAWRDSAVKPLAFGGLDQAKPGDATNDLHDLEYAILGALSHSLLTIDKRLQGTIGSPFAINWCKLIATA
jgi:hypothetical protein